MLLGFIAVGPDLAETLIAQWGYYYMLGLFAAFVFFAGRVGWARQAIWRPWLRRPGLTGGLLLLASAWVIWVDPFKHKVLFDEYVLQGTAFHLHATKEIGTIIRAYDIQGTWLPIDTYLDKRPYFFTFLVSLLHDVSGFRIINIYVVNILLTPLFIGLVYWLSRTVATRGAALMVVGLMATMPLLGQQATGAGMELHNLTMLVLVIVTGVLYLRAPGDDRLSLFVLTTVLLAQSRYESVIFVVPAAVVIVAGWQRAGRLFLPWPAVLAPLLLVPYAWHNRILSASPLLWQLNEGQTSRFSWSYLPTNLQGAWSFFFNFGPSLANSWYLSALGAAALIGLGWWTIRRFRGPAHPALSPAALVLVAFAVGIIANFVLLMFYYWSRLDDVVASRFALPFCLLLALVVGWFLSHCDRRLPATRLACVGLVLWALGWGIPATARRTYTSQNLVMKEVEWEYDFLRQRRGPLLFVSNKSSIPFVLWRIPTIIIGVARLRPAQITYHLEEGTFHEVIVAQALRPTSAAGEMGIDPTDVLPPNYRLEPLAEKRFGARWARLSRLVAIE